MRSSTKTWFMNQPSGGMHDHVGKTSMQRDPPYMDAHILMQRISGEVENKDQNLNFVILELMGRTYTKFYVKSLVI